MYHHASLPLFETIAANVKTIKSCNSIIAKHSVQKEEALRKTEKILYPTWPEFEKVKIKSIID